MIGNIQAKNRIIRSATFEGRAIKGKAGPDLINMYKNLAAGEVGLIITGYMVFSTTDHPNSKTVTIGADADLDSLKNISDTVHDHGSKIVMQISHQGSQLHQIPRSPVFGASAVSDPISGIVPDAFSREQIATLVHEFGAAALRAKEAGFDGVQIHGAHGYMLSKFMSPVYNLRDDEYGGSVLNRARIVKEILKEIKKTCGMGFPVWIKLNSNDFDRNENGLGESDFMAIAGELIDNGIDAIEVSGGTFAGTYSPCRSKKHVAYHLDAAKRLADVTDTSIILVGGVRNIDGIESILTDTNIAAVSMSRPFIREPYLVKRWMEGDLKDPSCISCNGCFNPEGTTCFHDLPKEKKSIQKEITKLFSPRD